MKTKPILKNIAILFITILICTVIIEVLLGVVLFRNIPGFAWLKKPKLFVSYFSDDYHKLEVIFGTTGYRSVKPYRIFGWIGDFSLETYKHNLSCNIQGRRPVLLYGDSFGRCNIKPCFHEILISDPVFSDNHYLLNFSRGNYGVDQIYLTMKYSIDLYDSPIVVFSFMTLDLDRVVLKLRPQQKPYFTINDERLILHTPNDLTMNEFVSENPPTIKSYLYSFVITSGRSFLSNIYKSVGKFKYAEERKKEVMYLSEKIILKAIEDIEVMNLDYIVLVFQPHWPGVSSMGKDSWREHFLKLLFEQYRVPAILV